MSATLTCVARSGQPTPVPEPDMPGPAADNTRVVQLETIVNGKREVHKYVEEIKKPAPHTSAKPETIPPPATPVQRAAGGWVAIPVLAVAVGEHTRIENDHLTDPKLKVVRVVYLHPEDVPAGVIRNVDRVVGRVVLRAKRAGTAFTERDFEPSAALVRQALSDIGQ